MSEDTKNLEMQRPQDVITVKVNGEQKTITMSAALVRLLAQLSGSDMTTLSDLYTDAFIQNMLLLETVRERDARGNPVDEKQTLWDYQLDIEEANKLVNFIAEHVFYFFTSGVKNAMNIAEKNKNLEAQLTKILTQSQSGSQA